MGREKACCGYGWVVVASSFVGHVLEYGVAWTVGIFYQIFTEQFDGNSAAIALVSSLLTATFYGAGSISGILTNRFGCRTVTMAGGLLGNTGLILSMYAKSIYHLYITFGVLAGTGYGMAFLPTVTIVGEYFTKRRTVALGIAVSGVGVGTFLWPVMIKILEETYGWRGALLLLGGIGMNICVCGALFRPVSTKTQSTKKTDMKSLFNLGIFKNKSYIFLCMNQILFSFGISVVYTHLPYYAFSEGLSKSESAYLISVLGICNLLGRFGLGFLAMHPRIKTLPLFIFCFFTSGLITATCGLYSHVIFLMTYASLFGLLTAAWGTLTPEIIVQLLGLHLLNNAYGYLLCFMAIGSLLGAPVAGWVYDRTHNYQTSFYLAGGCCMVSGLLILFPWRWSRKPLSPSRDGDVTKGLIIVDTVVTSV